jgi:Glycosyl transferase family 2
MSESPSLSVVLPCRNQADHIERVLSAYAPPLASCDYELVVVPNACTDGTPEIVHRLATSDARIRVVESANGGWGLSVLAGLSAARGRVLCYTNSARTDPAQIPTLLGLYQAHAPCLAKVRRVERAAPLREVGSWLYNLESRLLFGIRARDVNGTPKILSRELYADLDLSSQGDLLDLELIAKTTRRGIPIVEMPVRGCERHGGKSSTNLGSAWSMYVGAVRLRLSGGA